MLPKMPSPQPDLNPDLSPDLNVNFRTWAFAHWRLSIPEVVALGIFTQAELRHLLSPQTRLRLSQSPFDLLAKEPSE